jgi:hypothetical protein
MPYTVWAQHYIYEETDAATCNVNINEWRRIHEDEDQRIFAKVSVGPKTAYIALGAPVTEVVPMSDHTGVFLPSWLLDILEIEGSGETVEIEWLTAEHFPEATRIVLRPHDSAFQHSDIKEELERALTSIGVLQLGSTVPVSLKELGGFTVNFDVVGLEPTALVLMQGDEVAIEFDEAVDAIPLEPEPVPEALEGPTQMLPSINSGQKLGGVQRAAGWNPYRSVVP